MAEKVEEIQEFKDVRDLKERMGKLPAYAHKMLVDELINNVCFGLAPIDREWVDKEIRSFERIERSYERYIL